MDGRDRVDDDAQVLVWHRRYLEARQSGLEHIDAIRFARSDSDIGLLRKCVAKGCPPEQLREIVL